MKCPNCGKDIRDSAKVCGYCGRQVQNTPSPCPNCGKDVREGAKVCGYCGYKFTAASKPVPTIQTEAKSMAESPPRALQMAKTGATPADVQKIRSIGKPISKRRFPIGVWVVIGLVVLAGVGVVFASLGILPEMPLGGLPATPQKVYVCGEPGSLKAQADAPIKFYYGYWGVLEEFYEVNNESLTVEISIDGKKYNGDRTQTPRKLQELSCNNPARFDQEWITRSLWMYDTVTVAALEPGVYTIEVSYSMSKGVTDGMKDGNGNLAIYGPGQFQTRTFKLTVAP